MNNCRLKKWIKQYNIYEQTINHFYYCLNQYMKDEKEEYENQLGNVKKFHLEMICISYQIDFPELCNERIVIDAHILGDDINIGDFSVIYNKNGEIADEYFIIE